MAVRAIHGAPEVDTEDLGPRYGYELEAPYTTFPVTLEPPFWPSYIQPVADSRRTDETVSGDVIEVRGAPQVSVITGDPDVNALDEGEYFNGRPRSYTSFVVVYPPEVLNS